MFVRSRSCLLVACLLLAGGCSSFPRDFAAAKVPGGGSIAGPWVGEWVSHGGHRGELRCMLDPQHGSGIPILADRFDARFEAKFWGIFTAHYTVLLTGAPEGDAIHLSGDHDLGWLAGGAYHYDARVTARKFDAMYRSHADEGEFHMLRPESPERQ